MSPRKRSVPRVITKETHFPSPDFPLAVMRHYSQNPTHMHAHQFSELVVILSGRGVHATGGQRWTLAAGDVFVISGERRHEYPEVENLILYNILYDPEALAMPIKDLRSLPGYHALFTLEPAYRARHGFKSRLRLSLKELAYADGLVDKLARELSMQRPGSRFMALTHFMEIVGYLSRCYGRQRAKTSQELYRIGEAISYLENHYDRPVSLDALARMARMSKRNFQRVFSEAMGTSPIAYLLGVRITRAAELLRRRDMSVTEVAYQVGFEDSNYFTRQFRKIMGASPRQFLKSEA